MLRKVFLLLNAFNLLVADIYDFCKLSCPDNKTEVICPLTWKCDAQELCRAIKQDTNFRYYVVLAHNNIRNEVALGRTHLPEAYNMRVMNYDRHLEFLSTCYANTCKMISNDCNKTDIKGSIGQNYYMHPVNTTQRLRIYDIITQWANELDKVSTDVVGNFSRENRNNVTQIIWAKSTKVGCAQSTDKKFIYTYCSYAEECCTERQMYVPLKGKQTYQSCLHNDKFPGLCGITTMFFPPVNHASKLFINNILVVCYIISIFMLRAGCLVRIY